MIYGSCLSKSTVQHLHWVSTVGFKVALLLLIVYYIDVYIL